MMTYSNDSLKQLVEIMDELREKCPWDRKQTIQTLRAMTIEETYELADAIINEDWENLKEESGDLLLHIVFYAKIGEEQGRFTLDDVIKNICDKLITRHPHIYGSVEVKDEEDVKRNWEAIKKSEGKNSVMSGVPVSLPAIVKAMRIQEKAKQVGFEWKHIDDVWKKVEEEQAELKEAIDDNNIDHIEEEFGDLLFSLVNYARFLRLDPEAALERVNRKFIQRFQKMENTATSAGKDLASLSLEEMDAIWNSIKHENNIS